MVQLVIAGAIILVLGQLLFRQGHMPEPPEFNDPVRTTAAFGEAAGDREITATFELLDVTSLSNAKIMVNGSVTDDFRNRYATVKVAPGDALEIDGTFYEQPFRVKLVDIYPEVYSPLKGVTHTIKQERHLIGKVEAR